MLLRTLLQKRCLLPKWSFSMSRHKHSLYDTLGIAKSSSQSDVKKAYYKLAQELHPDKNASPNAKDKFAQINNAYQILSDEGKRKHYDQTGSTQENSHSGFENDNEDLFNQFKNAGFYQQGRRGNSNAFDFQSIFQNIFTSAEGGNNNRRGKSRNKSKDVNHFAHLTEDIELKVELDFNESVNGATKKFDLKRRCHCSICKGSGAKPGSKPQKCQTCHGTGFMTLQSGMMIIRTECSSCEGVGQVINSLCNNCSGKGYETAKVVQTVIFPKGIDNGAVLKFKDKGHLNGDLIVRVSVRKHSTFRREGNDSLIEKEINVVEAVLGATINVQTIYGETKKVSIPAGTQSGDKIKLAKQGFFKMHTNEKGNEVIIIKVKIPTKLQPDERSLYQKLKVFLK